MAAPVDPTTLAILARALHAAAEEMGVNLMRSAFSTIVREARDCSTALLDPEGHVVAQAEMIPMQLSALSMSFKACQAAFDVSRIGPGHAMILNDPYSGGQHLNDIILFTPIFSGDTLLGFAGSTAHHLDIGGGSAGINARATDIYQEGLVVPPLLFEVERDWHGGVLGRLFAANIRTPVLGVGDLNAQFAANFTGARRLRALAERVGVPVLFRAMAEVLDYSERRLRAAIEAIPDGTYEGEAFIDDDVYSPDPIPIRVTVRVVGSEIWLDFTGTAPQVRGMFNCPLSSSHAAAFAAIRAVASDKEIPANDGCNRPVHLHFPEGSLLNPRFPAPVRARMQAASRAFNAIHAALARALPDRVPAPGFDTTTGFYLAQQRGGAYRVFGDVLGGGYGAGRGYDGADATDNPLSNCRNTPVEAIEQIHDYLLVRRYALLPDSGGAGQWRGGLGFCREVEILDGGVELTIYSDHFKLPAPGRQGGLPGRTGSLTVFRRDERIALSAKTSQPLEPGDVVRLELGGGGGYGDPRQRAREAVERDLADGRVTPAQAGAVYGDPAAGAVDATPGPPAGTCRRSSPRPP
ncbi:MAG TPA: hydantoinase B/oxoprolinase family protein [Methylomirabilota bacterium]|nr:hydantoinase B/oxoprolinase family protein [Methylomirabilota bacterium]